MPETFWEPELSDQNRESQPQNPLTEAAALTVSAVDFSALEERIVRAVEMVKHERQARVAAEEKAAHAESEFHEQLPKLERLQKEINSLLAERDQVRQRVERLLSQLDALEL
jgi:predicted RNase H-like nuclease (RuvC/YqgF family)